MAAVADGDLGPGRPQLTSMWQTRGALALVASAWRSLWPVWLAAVVIALAVNVSAALLHIPWAIPGVTPSYLGIQIGVAALWAAMSAFTLRVYLGKDTGEEAAKVFRIDGALAAYVGLMVGSFLISLLGNLMVTGFGAKNAASPMMITSVLLGLPYVIISAIVMIKLCLWPVAILFGERKIGPRASWRLMRGATGGFIGAQLAFFVCLLLPIAAVEFLLRMSTLQNPVGLAVITALTGLASNIYTQAVIASVYRDRHQPTSLADVFD